MTSKFTIEEFKKLPIMGILRGISAADIEPLTEEVIHAGLRTIEITMNTDNACNLIKKMINVCNGKLFVGAGTVLKLDELKKVLDCGASFIVSPIFDIEIVQYCCNKSIPVFPGAFTPSEVYAAWQNGASMVKLFPAKFFGHEYIKELKGPFDKIEILACGGVNSNNISDFFNSGADAAAFGGSIFQKKWLANKKYNIIGDSITKLINSYNKK